MPASNRTLVLPVLFFVIWSAWSAAGDHVRTQLIWEGATAEQLRMNIENLFPGLVLAVVNDEKAVVYHEIPEKEVREGLEKRRLMRPDALVVNPPTSVRGPIPEPPEPQQKQELVYRPRRDALASLGITLDQVFARLRELQAGEKAVDLEKVSIKTPDGMEVPLSTVVNTEMVVVERPLVVRK